MRPISFLFFIGIFISLFSCRTDFETVSSNGKLAFSKDTIYLDTVFTNISSSTYTLKVYNNSNNDISIPSIKLGKGMTSKYRMTVDGMNGTNGKLFDNVSLLAKDSLYIFIETTANIADANPTDFLYTDQIEFDSGANLQNVELVTLIQDAVFIYPNRPLSTGIKETLSIVGVEGSEGHTLTTASELHWTKDKPYVIYGYAAVPNGSNLVIDKGTKVYYHADSGLIIDNGATLNINGEVNVFDASGKITTQNEVTFEGDRLEPAFEDVAGQWGTVLMFSEANNNINHLTLKNATVGLFLQTNVSGFTPKLTITNSQFYGCSNVGILARNADVTGKNLVINSAGQASLACTQGGSYDFTHCTFNNNWSSTQQLAVLIDNYFLDKNNQPVVFDLMQANFKNCIIYGSNNNELFFNKNTTKQFNYQFSNCLIKFNNTSNQFTNHIDYQFDTDIVHYKNIILNKDPKFLNIALNKLNIDETSAAFAKGNTVYNITQDILGNTRTLPPDLGAYQNKSFPKN